MELGEKRRRLFRAVFGDVEAHFPQERIAGEHGARVLTYGDVFDAGAFEKRFRECYETRVRGVENVDELDIVVSRHGSLKIALSNRLPPPAGARREAPP